MRFDEAFAKAYGTGGIAEGMKMGFDKWKEEQDNKIKRDQLAQLKQVFGYTPEGGLGLIGQVPKGSQVIPPASLITPQAKADLEVATAERKNKMPTADMKNALVTTRQSKSLIESVIKQSEGLDGGYKGMQEIAKSALNRGKGESAKYRTYLSTMPATAVSIYRAVTGDTRLSDSDAQARAYPLLWHPSEDVDVRKQKNDYIKSMVLAREALLSSGKFTTGEKGEAITDLGSVSAMAEKIANAKKLGYTDDEISAYYGAKNGK